MSQQNKKKVLIFLPGGVGGAERMSVLIGKILPKESFYVKFIVVGRLRTIFNIMPRDYDVECIPVRNIYAFSTLRIWWKIMKEQPDVVFASQAAYNSRVIIASRLAKCKVVIRSSGMVSKYSYLKRNEVIITYPWANLLIAQQEEMRDEMIRLLRVAPEKVVTIHNPLDYNNIDKLAKVPNPYLSSEEVIFINTASVCHRKAQDIAIRALSFVVKEISNAHLYFVGGYDEKSEYYRLLRKLITELELEDKVHFVGYDKNPFRWIKNSNCFVFPSRDEGLPNALIEASYIGVPCVAARCLKIIDEIIKDGQNGYVIDVDDVEGMAIAMTKAIKIKHCEMVYKPGTVEEFVKIFNLV